MPNPLGQIDDIILEDYNPIYPSRFATERDALRKILGSNVLTIEHLGSTAIPGIKSKPVIDIGVAVHSFPVPAPAIHDLEADQWIYWHDNPDANHQFFFKGMPRTHILHIYPANLSRLSEQLIFRNYLIGHPALAREYETLKINLAREYSDDREKYTAMKTDFIAYVLNLHSNE